MVKLILVFFIIFSNYYLSFSQKSLFSYLDTIKPASKEIFYIKGNKGKSFYADSSIKSIGKFDRKFYYKKGKWKYFYPNGKIKEIGKYCYGVKCGIWQYFTEEGMLFKEEVFRHGEIIN